MSFPRGGSPTFELTVPAETVDFTEVENITVSLLSGAADITKTAPDVTVVSATRIEVTLTQEETLLMTDRHVSIQVNWTYPGTDLRWATQIATVAVDRNLYMKVIE